MYSTILWSAQTQCALQHSPTLPTLSEENIKGNMLKKVTLTYIHVHKQFHNDVDVPPKSALGSLGSSVDQCQHQSPNGTAACHWRQQQTVCLLL